MVWDEETIRHLRELWAQGLSTAEIGRRLGVTKNAIVGKAHRLDLDARPSPIRRETTKPATAEAAHARTSGSTLPPLPSAQTQTAPALTPVIPAAAVQKLRLMPTAPRPTIVAAPPPAAVATPPAQPRRSAPACCWPIGEPGTKSFRFCDDASLPGKPYCEEHAKLAYVRVRDRKDDAA